MPLECRICGSDSISVETVKGKWCPRDYHIQACPHCGFSFVGDPDRDYEAIYSEEYYKGEGADPTIDYAGEMEYPHLTIRNYEWDGIVRWIGSLCEEIPCSWLDFGCGNGGLARFARQRGYNVHGYDESPVAREGRQKGVPILSREEFEETGPRYDVVTAIEVLEHLEDPISALRTIRSKLKNGGIFVYTTGNASRRPEKFSDWKYVVPEIHISYFQPKTMEVALAKTGFKPDYRGVPPGHEGVIRYKILKNLGVKRMAVGEKLLPWKAIARLANYRYGIFDFPVGIAQ